MEVEKEATVAKERARGWEDLCDPRAPRREREAAAVMAPEIRDALQRARLRAYRHDDGTWSILRLKHGENETPPKRRET